MNNLKTKKGLPARPWRSRRETKNNDTPRMKTFDAVAYAAVLEVLG